MSVSGVLQGTATSFDPYQIFSLQWWLQHLSDAYSENPGHTVVEFFCIVIIVWLLFKSPKKKPVLSKSERQFLLKEWKPEPLVPDDVPTEPVEKLVITAHNGSKVTVGGKQCTNFASYDYLNFSCDERIKKVCLEIIAGYGVGSCGPRGFYGTMDVHMDLEKEIPKYFGMENEKKAIIYADSIALAPSVITSFAKRGDLIIMDENCHYLIQKGAMLARSNVITFKHNDIHDLENVLKSVEQKDQETNTKLNRRFIIVEGVYHNRGDLCDLTNVCILKNKYKYRLMMDDSHALGTIDPYGSPAYHNLQWSDVDIYFCNLDSVLGSTGGFSMAAPEIIDHQVLSGSGYVFSASSPPFQVKAAQTVLQLLKADTEANGAKRKGLVDRLQASIAHFRSELKNKIRSNACSEMVVSAGEPSPLIHLRLPPALLKTPVGLPTLQATREFVEKVTKKVLADGFVVASSHRHVHEKKDLVTSLQLHINVAHTKEELSALADSITTHWKKEVTELQVMKALHSG